jgi:hypothetical protein
MGLGAMAANLPSLVLPASELFIRDKRTQAKEDGQAKEAELLHQYCCAEA